MNRMEKTDFIKFLIDTDDYEILSLLGSGVCGTVYKARDKNTGELVALKVIKIRDNTNAEKKTLQSFMREVINSCLLDLPGIVHLLGFRFQLSNNELKTLPKEKYVSFSSDGLHVDLRGTVIVTELMENSSLNKLIKDYLNKNPKAGFGPTQISKIIFGIAAYMMLIHKKGIIHRDLKLENIFLDENFEPRIADLCFGKIFSDIQQSLPYFFSICRAPELCYDEGDYDSSVDIYAFAMVLYRLFENKFPFSDGFAFHSYHILKIKKEIRFAKTDNIPDVYWDLIQMCWSYQPQDRPSFEEITTMLRDDKYAVKGFGMETDLEELHSYQKRITMFVDDEKITTDFNKTMCMVKNMSIFDPGDVSSDLAVNKSPKKPEKSQ